jgi:RNA polymerase sigma factor (sigma-70 family)
MQQAENSPDEQLLHRFVSTREEAAFTELVRRHAPLVWSVCKRVLHEWHDLEDAFQATFLILVRKAASIGQPELLSAWLHGVAYRVAVRARDNTARRRAYECQALAGSAPDPTQTVAWRELRPLLDEEVNRLPDKYRLPFILCYLDGKTNEEVARSLGCPTGTVLSRLSRARERLRRRLVQRGITLATGVFAALGPGNGSVVASQLIAETVEVSLENVAVTAVTPAAALADGAMKSMTLTTGRSLLVLLVALAGISAGLFAVQVLAAKPAAPAPRAEKSEQPATDQPADPRMKAEWWSTEVKLGKLGADVLGLSPDGRRMLLHHGPMMVCVDLTTARVVWQTDMKTLHNAAFSPDGKVIVTAEWEGGMGLFDAATGKRRDNFALGRDGEQVGQVGFLPDGRIVALANSWSYREDKAVDPPRVIQTLRFSLLLWDPSKRAEVKRRSEVLTYSGSNVWLWLIGRGLVMQALQEISENGRAVRKVVNYTDPITGKTTPTLEIHKDDDYRFDLSPSGTTLLVMTVGQPPRLLDVTTGKVKATLDGHKRFVTAGAFSPDGKLVATLSGSDISGYALAKLNGPPPQGPAELFIRETDTGRVIARHEYPTTKYDFTHVGFSPDGKYVYAITKDREQLVAWGQLPFDRPVDGKTAGLPDLPPLKPQQRPGPPPPSGNPLIADALDKLVEELARGEQTGAQQADALFLATLGRFPTTAELKRVRDQYGVKLPVVSLRKILAELLASPEFEAHVRSLQHRLPKSGFGPSLLSPGNPMRPFGGSPPELAPKVFPREGSDR